MATSSMHVGGVKALYPQFSKTSLHSRSLCLPKRLDFSVSFISLPALTASTNVPCRARDLTVTCQGANAHTTLECTGTEYLASEELVNQFTCVMKFGGSSVASAERMRQVADLIRSFPQERPLIVLSAMGKTTNNLLLVFYYLFFLCSFHFCVFWFFFSFLSQHNFFLWSGSGV